MLIDTHTHIYSQEFDTDIDEVIERSLQNDIHKLFMPNIDSSSIKPMLDLSNRYKQICYPMMGIHPTSVNTDFQEELEVIEYWLDKHKFIAIGEIGIDMYWDQTFREEQEYVFRQQLKYAQQLNLPVVIHTRDSFDIAFENILKENNGNLKGVFHCFTGTVKQANKVLDMGFKIGVGGVITFKNSGIAELVSQLKPHDIVLETDAPYLAPVPFRGKRNESSYLKHIAQKVAEVFELPLEQIEDITSQTALELFNLV